MLRACLATLLLAGCARVAPPVVGRYSLSPDALRRSGAHDLYEAVERLKPGWLDPCLAVFRNERFWGGPETLREFAPADPLAVHYIPREHPRPGAGTTALNGCPAIQVVMGS
jgi:hypothetical protein